PEEATFIMNVDPGEEGADRAGTLPGPATLSAAPRLCVRCGSPRPPLPRRAYTRRDAVPLHHRAVLHDEVHALEQADVAQHVATHGDDVRVLAFADRAVVIGDAHGDGRPVRRGADRLHRIDAQPVHPDVQLVPRRLAVELAGDAAVRADQQRRAGLAELLELARERRPAAGREL